MSRDWAATAAERIVDEVSEDVEWRNRRLVKPTAERIAAIIEDHAPFKEGVAYMPVPRCDACAFWQFGLCRLSSIDETFIDLPPVEQRHIRSRDLRAVTTRADFGCVQWKDKNA